MKNVEIVKCPNCLRNDAQMCEHLVKDEINGDYDCDLPEIDTDGDCESCQHTFCKTCKEKYGVE